MAKQPQKISIENITPEMRRFHNETIDVYLKPLHIKEIVFWPENARNLLDFEVLTTESNKDLEDLDEEVVIRFLAKQPRLKLSELKKSIKLNGVKIPLIVLEDGTLLDGNRRFFACKLLQYELEKENKELPDELKKIPTYVIKNKDIDETKKKKILAEANFVPDFKVDWSLDVKAKVIKEFYDEALRCGLDTNKVFTQIIDVYSVKPSEAKDYITTCKLVDDFIGQTIDKQDQLIRRRIVEQRFVYFWEFYNKSYKGRGAPPEGEVPEIKDLFFSMMRNNRFNNLKQIEPMIRAKQESHLWSLLTESKGIKIKQVEAIIKEKKAGIAIKDKFRNFLIWLEKQSPEKLEKKSLTGGTIVLIKLVVEKLQHIIKL